MKNRRIIQQLISMLDRNNPDLLFIVLNFLKKLSIFGHQYELCTKNSKTANLMGCEAVNSRSSVLFGQT